MHAQRPSAAPPSQHNTRTFHHALLPVPGPAGALGGLLGALFIHLNVRITQFRHRHIPFRSPWRRLAEVVCLSFVTASIWFLMAWSSPCRPLPSPVRTPCGLAVGARPRDRCLPSNPWMLGLGARGMTTAPCTLFATPSSGCLPAKCPSNASCSQHELRMCVPLSSCLY